MVLELGNDGDLRGMGCQAAFSSLVVPLPQPWSCRLVRVERKARPGHPTLVQLIWVDGSLSLVGKLFYFNNIRP